MIVMLVKFWFLTCAFYVGICALLLAGLLVASRFDMIGVNASRWGWTFIYGLVWLASFNLGWHFLVGPFLGRLPK